MKESLAIWYEKTVFSVQDPSEDPRGQEEGGVDLPVWVKLKVWCRSLGVRGARWSFVGHSPRHLGPLPKHPLEKPFTLSIAVLTPHTHTYVILFLGRQIHSSKTKELTFFVLLMIKCMKLSLGWIIIWYILCSRKHAFFCFVLLCSAFQCTALAPKALKHVPLPMLNTAPFSELADRTSLSVTIYII